MLQYSLDPINLVKAANKDSSNKEVEEGSINVADSKKDKESTSSKKDKEDNNKFVNIEQYLHLLYIQLTTCICSFKIVSKMNTYSALYLSFLLLACFTLVVLLL